VKVIWNQAIGVDVDVKKKVFFEEVQKKEIVSFFEEHLFL
jgi:hypothetical protein